VAVIAVETVATTQQLFTQINADRAKVLSGHSTSVAGIRLFELLPAHPIITVAEAVTGLVEAGLLVETTGRRRDRAFSYEAYLNLLRAETEPL
jgi:hypothetical protein